MPRQRQGSGARPTLGVDMRSIQPYYTDAERVRRYVDAVGLGFCDEDSCEECAAGGAAAMALADAEQAELRAEVESMRRRADYQGVDVTDVTNDERAQRYRDALFTDHCGCGACEQQLKDVMAVADAEQAELRALDALAVNDLDAIRAAQSEARVAARMAELRDEVRTYHYRATVSEAEMALQQERAERAEARVEELERWNECRAEAHSGCAEEVAKLSDQLAVADQYHRQLSETRDQYRPMILNLRAEVDRLNAEVESLTLRGGYELGEMKYRAEDAEGRLAKVDMLAFKWSARYDVEHATEGPTVAQIQLGRMAKELSDVLSQPAEVWQCVSFTEQSDDDE